MDLRWDRNCSAVWRQVPAPMLATMSPGEGTEHITSADTCDADYSRLLARAYANGKGLASPAGLHPLPDGKGGFVPGGIRTRVTGVKGRRPGPLDDGDTTKRTFNYNMRLFGGYHRAH